MGGRLHIAVLKSPVLLGAVLFGFSVLFPPFEDLTEVDLTIHMLQHVLIALAGAAVAYHYHRTGRLRSLGSPGSARLGLVAVGGTLVFWHLPFAWDTAVLNPLVHVLEHFSFLLVGLLAGSTLMAFSDSGKIGTLVLAFFGHMAYAIVLISPTSSAVYPLYSVAQQATVGWALILTGPAFLVGAGYLLLKNPAWLQGSGISTAPRLGTPQPRRSGGALGAATAALTLLMLLTLVGYFGYTAVAISAAPPRTGAKGAVVYISETPVTWQYSPQVIRVVLGVNSTVTWVSHSVSYDTVTSSDGVVVSGPIAPGQSFTFSFSRVGEVDYHCAYHPWMVGKVIVLPAT